MSFVESNGELLIRLQSPRQTNLIKVDSWMVSGSFDIIPLWYAEIYRRQLVDLGITGRFISNEDFSDVLSVIRQISRGYPDIETDYLSEESGLSRRSNKKYHPLHEALIDQNIATLNALGNQLAIPVEKKKRH